MRTSGRARKRRIPNRHQRVLPPPGDARREEMHRRDDELAQQGEERAAGLELHGINPNVLRLQNEIASKLDRLRVPGALPEMVYCWTNWKSQEGMQIQLKKLDGWELVCGTMTEAPDLRDELGRRKIGDTVLMRMRLDDWVKLDRDQRALRKLREEGVEAALLELGERFHGQGVIVHERVTPDLFKKMATGAAARGIARQAFAGMVRGGRVRGMPAAGR